MIINLKQLALTTLGGSLALTLGCLYAAVEMHKVLLTSVLRWSMDVFDTTPLGRILNRFSKDIDVVDNVLPHCIQSWRMMFFSVIL